VINSTWMARWIKAGLVGLAAGALALILALVISPRTRFFGRRSDAWDSRAIESTFAGVRVREIDPTHASVVFFYDLDNKTDSDYRLATGPNVVIMSRLRADGSLSSDQPVALDSAAFVPAKNRTRIAVEVRYPFDWPPQRDASADRQIRQLVADQVVGLNGFVLFDQSTRYQIELATVAPEFRQAAFTTGRN
jgi:hypothetical protein